MNQEPNHLAIAPDEATAARITAWVLGQASAFEAEQLEELCRNEPLWLEYSNQVRKLHSHLVDATHLSDEEKEWKISPEKRQSLLDKIGTPPPKAKRTWRISRAALARAACITVFFGLSGAYFVQSFGKKNKMAYAETSAIVTYSAESPREMLDEQVLYQKDHVAELRQKKFSYSNNNPSTQWSMNGEAAPAAAPASPDDYGVNTPTTPNVFAGGGGGIAGRQLENLEVIREMQYPTEYEPPASLRYSGGTGIASDKVLGREIAKPAKNELANLDDPIRTNPALTFEHAQQVDQVRRSLHMGEGKYQLGKYDDAKKEFEEVLRVDPSNKAARHGLERVAATKSDYYRSAYDHNRAEMLAEVDKDWDQSVPAEPANLPTSGNLAVVEKGAKALTVNGSLAMTSDGAIAPQQVNRGNIAPVDTAFASGEIAQNGKQSGEVALGGVVDAPKKVVGDAVAVTGAGTLNIDAVALNSNQYANPLSNGEKKDQFQNIEQSPGSQLAVLDGKSDATISGKINSDADSDWDGVTSYYEYKLPAVSTEGQVQPVENRSAQLDVLAKKLKSQQDELQESQNRLEQINEKSRGLSSATNNLASTQSLGELQQSADELARKREEMSSAFNEQINTATDEQTKAKLSSDFATKLTEVKNAEDQIRKAVSDGSIDGVANLEDVPMLGALFAKQKQKQKEDVGMEALNQGAVTSYKSTAVETPETPTHQDPYSTFSLRVSDASFQLAYDALMQDKRPQAQDIRVEDFYNAFDYGDPAPAAGEPVVCFMEQAAHPLLPSRNWLRLGVRVGSSGRSAAQPLHFTLVVDQSGSMEREDRNQIMNAAMREFGHLLTENDRISVIGFSRTPRLLGENITGAEREKWQTLVTAAPNDGGTNLEEALALGETIATRQFGANAQNRILLLTDGAANLGNADPSKLAARVNAMRQRGLCFDAVGIGTGGENDRRLLELVRNGNGRYQVLQNVGDAKERFAQQLAGAFRPAAENVKVQVRFNEERVAGYKLHGFLQDRLKTEDFRNDQVDAAEMAEDEAGNALYQLMLHSEGSGDIGEVSVRFRDPATGQMVERKWTIAYQNHAPAFDLASPSMQLAGMSLLVGEKLQGTNLGNMARPAEMTQSIETIRKNFSSQPAAMKLLEMVRKVP